MNKGTSIWKSKAWKERRAQVISRTDACERCREPFNGNPKVVNHLRRYASEEFHLYAQMLDDDVEVLCKKCNFKFTFTPWVFFEDQNHSDVDFAPGHRVMHRQYGVGTVVSVLGNGSNARVEVCFPGVKTNRIVARFLRIVGNEVPTRQG